MDQERLEKIIATKPPTGRDQSLKDTLRKVAENFGFEPINIVETGTIRHVELNYRMGDGWATLSWILWADETDSKVWTVDIDQGAIDVCRGVTNNHPKVSYEATDSIGFLKNFDKPIHLLYLDSYDWDGSDDAPNHQLAEIQAAVDKIVPNGLVLTDDNPDKDWAIGKGKFSIQWMLDNGFEMVHYKDSQVLLQKKA